MIKFNGILHQSARLLSDLVSPPVVAAVFGFLVAWKEQPSWTGFGYALIYAFWMCLVPLGVVIFLARTGRIHDLHMSNSPEERRIPYLIGFACALAAFLTFTFWLDSPLLRTLAVSNIIVLAVLGLINNHWLISSHSASIMLVAVFCAYVFGLQAMFWCLLLVGLVVWARWLLQKHTPSQLVAGMLVGALSVLVLATFGWF
jgi:membrane-associated phospholipid phosphatase